MMKNLGCPKPLHLNWFNLRAWAGPTGSVCFNEICFWGFGLTFNDFVRPGSLGSWLVHLFWFWGYWYASRTADQMVPWYIIGLSPFCTSWIILVPVVCFPKPWIHLGLLMSMPCLCEAPIWPEQLGGWLKIASGTGQVSRSVSIGSYLLINNNITRGTWITQDLKRYSATQHNHCSDYSCDKWWIVTVSMHGNGWSRLPAQIHSFVRSNKFLYPLTFPTLRWTLANLNREWWSISSPLGIHLVLLYRTLVAEKIFSCFVQKTKHFQMLPVPFFRRSTDFCVIFSTFFVMWHREMIPFLNFSPIWKDHWYPLLAFTIQHPQFKVTHGHTFWDPFSFQKRTFLWAGLHDITSFQSDLLPCRTMFHTFFPHWFVSWRSYPLSMHGQELRGDTHLLVMLWYQSGLMDSTQGYSLASWLDFQCLCWTSWWLSLPTPWSSPACQSLAWHCEIMRFSLQAATSIVDVGKCKGHWVGQGDVGLHCVCSELRVAWFHDKFWCWVSFSMVTLN